jgi:chemotaxis protein CheD
LSISQVTQNETTIIASLGEVHVSREPHIVLACLGLGSCIGMSAYDPVARIGGMAHIVLPQGHEEECKKAPAKYANSAVPLLLTEMEKLGASRNRVVIKIAGGARIIASVVVKSILDIGDRNIAAVKDVLFECRIPLKSEDIRGTHGRSLWLYVETGITKVRTAAQQVMEL